MRVSQLFNTKHDISNYLDYYFRNMVNLPQDKKIFSKFYDDYYLSIMKDETKRVLSGSGKLRERPWSNFLFYSIAKKDYEDLFGINKKRREINCKISDNGEFSLSEWVYKENVKNENDTYINSKNNYKISKSIFDDLKKYNPFLFIRSYVYITIIIVDSDNPISTKNFQTYFFNTNYKFTETNGKKNFIPNTRFSYLVENIDFELEIIKQNNRDIIDCVKAFKGELDFTQQTRINFENIAECIENGEKYVLVDGTARTGKTILAMCLMHKYIHSNLLVMNYYFYNALKDAFVTMNCDFPEKRIFHQAYGKKGYYDGTIKMNYNFCIIDECQRLGTKYAIIDRIIDNEDLSHSIFLGDDLQKIKSDTDEGIDYIIKKVVTSGSDIKMFKFTSSIGVPPEIIKNVKYLLNYNNTKNPCSIGEYNIKLFEEKEEFLQAYKDDPVQRKHLATIQVPNNFSPFGNYTSFPKQFINTEFPYFLNKEVIDNHYLSPFELISREVESIYIFVRSNINISNIKDFVLTQLYVLMTRATISLNLFFEDENTSNFFKNRVSEIYKLSTLEVENIQDCIKEGEFFIQQNISDRFNLAYSLETPKENIKQRLITKLVHFTEANNIESILEHGILPREYLDNNNITFDFNDENRFDNHLDSISLSVENPNSWLLDSFKRKYPSKKFKLLIIDPSILFTSFYSDNETVKLTKRIYCNYNAAANSTKKSEDNFEIMFQEKVQTFHRVFSREGKQYNTPTAAQAEILYFGRIPPEYIESIEDI